MKAKKLPAGWDDLRIRRVIAHYDNQSESEAIAEDEAGVRPPNTVMSVPHELVPKIRALIAKNSK